MLSQNDQEHFTRLWTSRQSSVANYVHALVRDRAAAEDVLQETALLIFRRFGEYDAERPFVAWALGITRFKVMGLRRDAARGRLVFDEEALQRFTESWAEQSVGQSERGAALENCLDKLADHSLLLVGGGSLHLLHKDNQEANAREGAEDTKPSANRETATTKSTRPTGSTRATEDEPRHPSRRGINGAETLSFLILKKLVLCHLRETLNAL